MKWETKSFIMLGTLAFIMVSITAFIMFDNDLFTIIGEEGFKPYDPALIANSYTPELWGLPSGQPISENTINFYKGTTNNLYLKDFRTEIHGIGQVVDLSHCSMESSIAIIADGVTIGNYPIGIPECASSCANCWPEFEDSSMDIRWDDYETGHFQVFKNNKLIVDGNARESLILHSPEKYRPARTFQGDPVHNFINPRVRDLFGCDNEEGMLIVDACYGGAAVIKRADLEGWVEGESKFCLELHATHIVDGLTASSQRVYYELASGEPIAIQENEAWKFSYMTPDASIGEKIGFGNGCEDNILMDDINDLDTHSELISNRKIHFIATQQQPSIKTGMNTLFTAHTPKNKCDTENTYSTAPTCWEFTTSYNKEYFIASFIDAYAQKNADGIKDNWKIIYDVELTKNPLPITNAAIQDKELSIDVENKLEHNVEVTISAVFSPQIINQELTQTAKTTNPKGKSTFTFDRPPYEGTIDAYVAVFINTQFGGIQASDEAHIIFDKEINSLDLGDENLNTIQNEGTHENAQNLTWWDKIVYWFLGLFGG